MKNMMDIFGENLFSEQDLKNRVPNSVYKEFKLVQRREKELSYETADAIANAVKIWATEKGATHFTHWFQPLTELTAEKHESFIAVTSNGEVMSQFSGNALIKGEADTSSFPNGGLRSTFEARGYTAWDASSPMFLKGDGLSKTLFIPTAYVGYNGDALDKKVPLLRSLSALEKQTIRVQRILGDKEAKYIDVTLGIEQEYFLVNKDCFEKRLDLSLAGRTIFGSLPPKGQELNDHYYGTLKEKIENYMAEVDAELWKIGVMAKTKHNEVAPNQFELALMFSSANIAIDHNQLVMDVLKKVALRHDMVALLHEKPFTGVNGSGKHCNWSLATDKGVNLLDPSDIKDGNLQFLLYTTAIIEGIDRYADILRATTATPGNDHRLGGHEAPPAIISIFLGDEIQNIFEDLNSITSNDTVSSEVVKIGVKNFPKVPKDISDRNRTSPFAFTGNKFEFRMPGSSASPSTPTFVLNTIVADILKEYADILEKFLEKDEESLKKEIINLIKDRYHKHKRIIFNGNGYEDAWKKEAEKRGLVNFRNTIEGIPAYINPKNIALFERTKVLKNHEIESLFKIYSERYSKQINIEVITAIRMCRNEIFPSITTYISKVVESIKGVSELFGDESLVKLDKEHILNVINLKNQAKEYVITLKDDLKVANQIEDEYERAKYLKENIVPTLKCLRTKIDAVELHVERSIWPIPTYYDLLFKL